MGKYDGLIREFLVLYPSGPVQEVLEGIVTGVSSADDAHKAWVRWLAEYEQKERDDENFSDREGLKNALAAHEFTRFLAYLEGLTWES